MKLNSLFLLIISLASVSSLVDVYPASAQRVPCTGSRCSKYTLRGTVGRGTLPSDFIRQLDFLNAQGNFAEVERLLLQFIGQAESTQDLNGQAAAHQGLADVYIRMGRSELAPIQLNSAGALYRKSGNSAGSSEVQVQLRQMQLQQIQLQQIQLQRR